jgi:hypothetical protein
MAASSCLVPSTGMNVESLGSSPPQPHLCKPCTRAIISARGTWGRRHLRDIHSKFLQFVGKRRPPKSFPYACRPSLDEGCFGCWHIAQQHGHFSIGLEAGVLPIRVVYSTSQESLMLCFDDPKDGPRAPLRFQCSSADSKSASLISRY